MRRRQASAYWGIVVASAFSESTGAHAPRYCVAVRWSWVNVCGISLAGMVSEPRGAYAPRSCVAVRMSAGEKRFLRWTNACSQERRA
jgi:hypothetical protein